MSRGWRFPQHWTHHSTNTNVSSYTFPELPAANVSHQRTTEKRGRITVKVLDHRYKRWIKEAANSFFRLPTEEGSLNKNETDVMLQIMRAAFIPLRYMTKIIISSNHAQYYFKRHSGCTIMPSTVVKWTIILFPHICPSLPLKTTFVIQ